MRDSLYAFTELGATLIAVSADPVADIAAADRDHPYGFPLLSDPALGVIDRYGLHHDDPEQDHPISRPATFVLDVNGVVQFAHVGEHPRDRPEVGILLLAVERIPG